MNLTARERLLMSLTSKQVEEWISKPRIIINLEGEIEFYHSDLLHLLGILQQRDQQVINENKPITFTSDELKFVKPTDKEMRERANEPFKPISKKKVRGKGRYNYRPNEHIKKNIQNKQG